MPMKADQPQVHAATPVDLGAIFVSLELSKSTSLVTALSPGSEKMSRHTITGGDIAGLFACFAALRQKAQRRSREATSAPARAALLRVRGIGPEFATILYTEGLFRHFDNRRQIASYAGLAPSPWQSGNVNREQGVSKAGNPRLRATMIELAWLWLRHQPNSALTSCSKSALRATAAALKRR